MAQRPRVAVLVESTRAYGRGQLAGIASYLRQHGPWSLFWQERGLSDRPPVWLRHWEGDGVIARISTQPLARAIRRLAVPTVDLYGWLPGLKWPCLRADNAKVARLAADHLLERGFRHLAYCGFHGVNYSDERLRFFQSSLREAGHVCHVCPSPRVRPSDSIAASEQQGLLYEAELADWLRELPKPVGILACNDVRGQQILNSCREIGVLVPDQVAVLGVDNDEVLCSLSDPPLSSVDLSCARIGFEAAALLARLLRGQDAPDRTILVEPRGIVTRRSTDVLAIEDVEVAEAVRLIRVRACAGLTVHELLALCSLSASSLERRFLRFLGRTPKEEIVRVRLQRVVELLAEPDLSLTSIASRTGFKHPEYLSAVFKNKFGMTLGQYRSRVLHSRLIRDP
ncbi:MAG TPA: XylR family transcriptional regulator [Gemmataceae bacterium]|nr:XylR family transcriptional regulator [Gemmataceae bacterium]